MRQARPKASPEIDTARLRLRPLTPPDLDALHRLLIQPGVRRYLLDDEVIPRERTRSFIDTSVASFEANGYGLWGAIERARGELIGFCGFWLFHEPPRLELLYGLGDDHGRKGFATEMAAAMIRYGFETLAFDRIEASTDAPNTASVAVMQRAGMAFWKREITNGFDTIYYTISAAPR
jgi:RimJ/RimL family protein N-acetyltransferase